MTRAQTVANELLGTGKTLSDFATDAEINDSEFCMALDSIVMQCECCGWWVEAEDVTDGNCTDCRINADPSELNE